MASRAHGVRSPPALYPRSASSESPQQFRGALCQPTPDFSLKRSAALARKPKRLRKVDLLRGLRVVSRRQRDCEGPVVISHSHRMDDEKNPNLAAALKLAEFG